MPRGIGSRNRGLRVDGAALSRELTARGLRGEDLARLAGVSEDVVSRARRGLPIDRTSLLKVVAALDKQPLVPLLDKLAIGAGAG